ncbi:peptidyl-tRNA hydrolase [Geodermatophilus sp. SYSU D00758]
MHVGREAERREEGYPEEAPWAMQLVARIERSAPPTRTAVCEAAAVAVVRLLADERARPGGEWSPQVRRWADGRIRKHCRRARGVTWERVRALPGVTAEVAGAQLRALVPTATDGIPREVARLPLSGRELDDPDARRVADPSPGGSVVVSICPEPPLPLGKAAAAAGHAAQLTAARLPGDRLAAWAEAGFPVVVEHPDPARWAELRGHAPVQVVDAGLTAVAPGTCTALARWA